MLKVYEYAKCSTCKNALKFLDKKGVRYKKIAVVDQPPSIAELKSMLGFLDGHIKKLFNTSGVLYRELKLSEKVDSMSESAALKLLSKNGRLIKRPFVISDEMGMVGFKEAEWKFLLK